MIDNPYLSIKFNFLIIFIIIVNIIYFVLTVLGLEKDLARSLNFIYMVRPIFFSY